MKKCIACQELKELSSFHRDSHAKDGHRIVCKICRKAAGAAYRENNPKKSKARDLVSYAVTTGSLIKPKDCSVCHDNSKVIQGHHTDYNKPLDVMWVCQKCHCLWHRHNESVNG